MSIEIEWTANRVGRGRDRTHDDPDLSSGGQKQKTARGISVSLLLDLPISGLLDDSGAEIGVKIITNSGEKVAENTDRSNPKVPKLSDDRGCLDRYCQGGNGGNTSYTHSDLDRSSWDRYF